MSSLAASSRTGERAGATRGLVAVLLATVVAPLNATMIVVALPALSGELHAGAAASSLLVVAYLAPMALLPSLGGRLGDSHGRRGVLLAGLALFGLASLGAASAPSLGLLLACRAAQALGGALAFPNALALLRELVAERRRGLSFGIVGTAMALSAAAGPPLGQLLVWYGGWRWVFAVNVPLVVLAVAASSLLPRPARDADASGNRSRGIPRSRSLAAATLAMGLSNLALYAALVGIPLLLSASRGSETGLLLMPLLAMAALVGPVAGRLADLRGRRAAGVAGLCILAAALLPIALAGERIGLQGIAAALAMAGAGLGASSVAIQTGGIEAAGPAASGAAAGLLATSRYLGGAAGSGVLPLVLTLAPHESLRALFAVAALAALLAAVAGAGLDSRPRPDPNNSTG